MSTYIECIIIAVVHITEALIVYIYAGHLFMSKRSRLRTILAFLIGYTALYIVYIIWDNLALNAISYLIINMAILYMIFSCGFITAFFHSITLTALMALSEIAGSAILSIFSGDYLAYTYRPSVLVALFIISKLIYLILSVIGARAFTPHNAETYENKSMLKLCTLPVVSICTAAVIFYICVLIELPTEVQVALSVCLGCLLLANIYTISIYSNTEKINRENLSMRLALQKDESNAEYYKMLEEQYDRQRILVHDVKNHMQAINGLAVDGDLEEIQRYITEWGYDKDLQKQVRYCQNAILNIIVSKVSKECSDNGITFHCDIRDKSIDFIDDIDISALFGNLLSNAYEAAKDSDEKLIEFDIKIKPDQKTTTVKISNSCNEPPTKDERGLYVSRKVDKEKHGLGQKSIKRIIEKYSGTSETYYFEVEKRFEMVIVFSEQR